VSVVIPALRATPTPEPTAIPAPTKAPVATAVPTPVPTVSPTPGPETGALIYDEDFVTPGEEWQVNDAGDAVYAVEGEMYSVEVKKASWMAWNGTKGEYGDFVLEFDSTLVEGDKYNAIGALFRFVDKNNYYELDINGNQSYSIGMDIDDTWTQLVPWTQHDAILPLGQTNRVRLMAHGSTFSLYVNDELVGQFTDSTFSSGDVAVVVTAYDTPPALGTFDNIKVWQLQTP
jgi:hypothetical protein